MSESAPPNTGSLHPTTGEGDVNSGGESTDQGTKAIAGAADGNAAANEDEYSAFSNSSNSSALANSGALRESRKFRHSHNSSNSVVPTATATSSHQTAPALSSTVTSVGPGDRLSGRTLPVFPTGAEHHLRVLPPRKCRLNVPVGDDVGVSLVPQSYDVRQQYNLEDLTGSLTRNCALGGFVMRSSQHGRSLFVRGCKSFPKGAVLGYMYGKVVSEDVWERLRSTHIDPTHRAGEEDYAKAVNDGVWRAVQTADGYLLASAACPMTLIDHTDDIDATNASIDITGYSWRQPERVAEDCWRSYPIFATHNIDPGQQVLTSYGWKDADWKQNRVVHRRQNKQAMSLRSPSQVPSKRPQAAGLLPGSRCFQIDAGIGRPSLRFGRQEKALLRFVTDHADELRGLRYHWKTVPPKKGEEQMELELKPSTLPVPGLFGVFPKRDHQAANRPKRSVICSAPQSAIVAVVPC